MTDDKLSSLEDAARAATPGPWRTEGYSILRYSNRIAGAQSNGSPEIYKVLLDGDYDPKTRHERALRNAAFIAAASPDKILELIAELRKLKQHCAQLTKERRYLAKCLEYNNGPDMRVSAYEYIARAKEATRND